MSSWWYGVINDGWRQALHNVLTQSRWFAHLYATAVIGGGYDRDVDALARRHALVHEEAAFVWRKHKLWQRVEERASEVAALC